MTQFESNSSFNVIHVNIDAKSSSQYRENMKYFEGKSIPYWAVLNKGQKVHGFVGGQSYESLVNQTKKYK